MPLGNIQTIRPDFGTSDEPLQDWKEGYHPGFPDGREDSEGGGSSRGRAPENRFPEKFSLGDPQLKNSDSRRAWRKEVFPTARTPVSQTSAVCFQAKPGRPDQMIIDTKCYLIYIK